MNDGQDMLPQTIGKTNARALVKSSFDFVMDHKNCLIPYVQSYGFLWFLAMIVPTIVHELYYVPNAEVGAVDGGASAQQMAPLSFIGLSFLCSLVSAFFMVCYLFSWHRSALVEVSPDNIVRPFDLTDEQKFFVISVLKIAVACIAFIFLFGILGGVMGAMSGNVAVVLVGLVLLIVAFGYYFAFLCRVYLILPAAVDGEKIGVLEGNKYFKGVVWLYSKASLWMLLFLIPAIIVMCVLVAGIAFGTVSLGISGLLSAVLYKAVEFVFMIFASAIGAVMLSKIYLVHKEFKEAV